MLTSKQVDVLRETGRKIVSAKQGDEVLGPLKLLPGRWANLPGLPGRGWNMIALPFKAPGGGLDYRLLLNQYNEELVFRLVDKGVPNRGLESLTPGQSPDQLLVALDYEQTIAQIAADDRPQSGLAGPAGQPIHHEPGLWLLMLNEVTDGLNLARLATIPHGDAVLALGRAVTSNVAPNIPSTSGLPIGVAPDLNAPYLAPYRHFHDNPFQGLFDPTQPHALLRAANTGVNITRTTVLGVDTTHPTGGIVNIPFVTRQANAASMRSTFWIQELAELDAQGLPKLRLQYLQVVMLDFFPRRDGLPGRISWPHISINTLELVRPAPVATPPEVIAKTAGGG